MSWRQDEDTFGRPIMVNVRQEQALLGMGVIVIIAMLTAFITMPIFGTYIIYKRGWHYTPLWFRGLWILGILPYSLVLLVGLPLYALVRGPDRVPPWLAWLTVGLGFFWVIRLWSQVIQAYS